MNTRINHRHSIHLRGFGTLARLLHKCRSQRDKLERKEKAERMKKIIAQIIALGMMTFAAAHARAAELNAMESPSEQGRVFISVSDFQKVILGSERVLSSENADSAQVEMQDASKGNGSLAALQSMSHDDKILLYKKVLPLAKKQAQDLSRAMTALKKQLAKIKLERKSLQAARISQGQDGKLQEKLFSNILEESNLESKIAEATRQIEESNVLVLEYNKVGANAQLVTVKHGHTSLWNKDTSLEISPMAIAQN